MTPQAQSPIPASSEAPGSTSLSDTKRSVPPADLAGTGWLLEELEGEPLVEGTSVTAEFTGDGMVVGWGGCNGYRSPFTTSGDAIEVDAAKATTRMACEPPVMTQEASYFAALAAARTFTVANDRLTLMSEGGTAVASFTSQSQGLTDTSWQVVAYNDGRSAVVSVLEGTRPSLAFNSNGRFTGFSGCNYLFGRFTAQDGKVKVPSVGSTEMFCVAPEGVMKQEEAIFRALESAATYVIEAQRLTLRTAEDAIAIELKSRPTYSRDLREAEAGIIEKAAFSIVNARTEAAATLMRSGIELPGFGWFGSPCGVMLPPPPRNHFCGCGNYKGDGGPCLSKYRDFTGPDFGSGAPIRTCEHLPSEHLPT